MPTTTRISAPWHALPVAEVLERLLTTQEGLSDEEASRRLAEYGKNILPVKKPPTVFYIFARQFLSPLIYILVAAAGLSLYLGDRTDSFFIAIVLLINALVGTVQEWKAEKGAAALRKLLTSRVRVRRMWAETEEDAESVVPGDIVVLESGNKVPADVRLIETQGVMINEAFLTGESMPVEKTVAPVAEDVALTERHSMAFAGSSVIRGRMVGVVVATSNATEVGKIAQSLSAAESGRVPLLVRMERFTKEIALVVAGVSVFIAAISLARGIHFLDIFFVVVGLAVSAIPEGLPVAITVALSISTTRMSARRVIVRRLSAVEGLGSCTYIASDKTGTLTANVQHAKIVSLVTTRYNVTGEAYSGDGEINGMITEIGPLLETAAVVNEAHLERKNGNWKHHGDTIEVSLLALAYKGGADPASLRAGIRYRAQVPYESERQYSMAAYERDGNRVVAMKGAFEAVIGKCSHMQTPSGIKKINPELIAGEVLGLAEHGYRVIACAYKKDAAESEMSLDHIESTSDLTLAGLVGFIDPPRPEAKTAMDVCRRAGIRVGIITGDHPATALAIAREVGVTQDADEVVTGAQLDVLGDPETPAYLERVRTARVFARVAPLQKLHIVSALKRLGETVAVTGDGVNDAPALQAASIGVAMGSGSDVAKDTASLVVTDDNFSSIVAGVEEGRHAYSNIRKVILLLISTGAAELVLFILSVLAGLPLPLFAVQLLWLNLVTEGVQDVALAAEGEEPGLMDRPPRPSQEGIFNRRMVEQVSLVGITMGIVGFLSWWYLVRSGWELAAARNMLLLILVLFENIHLFSTRSEYRSAFRIPLSRNYFLIAGVALAQGLHFFAMYWPPLARILHVQPISAWQWVVALAISSSVLIVMEVYKWVRRKSP